MDRSLLGTAVMDRRPHEYFIDVYLRILDLDVEVSVVIENARVDQLELHCGRATTTRVLLDQQFVWISGLRQLVEQARVGVTRDSVEIIVQLFDVLAVVTFFIRQAKQPLLEDRIATVPQGD